MFGTGRFGMYCSRILLGWSCISHITLGSSVHLPSKTKYFIIEVCYFNALLTYKCTSLLCNRVYFYAPSKKLGHIAFHMPVCQLVFIKLVQASAPITGEWLTSYTSNLIHWLKSIWRWSLSAHWFKFKAIFYLAESGALVFYKHLLFYSASRMLNLLDFKVSTLIKSIYNFEIPVFAGKVFQQIVGIPMGTNCAPLLADIFLYWYEAEFIQSLLSAGMKRLASQFNFTYRYIDDVLSINNPDFENYLGQMYPPELEIKDTTESNTFASYLDLLLSIGRDGQLHTSLYDKRDDFNFHITNFPFLSSNIPSSPAYGVFI